MSLPWFRMYAEFAKDAKVQSMDETLQRRLVMLFCLKCSDELELSHDELACALRISGEEMETTLEVFRRKGFMDEHDHIVHWDKRQFASDSSTNRVRRYRERKGNGDETLRKRSGNGAVTPPDTDTDTEKRSTVAKRPTPPEFAELKSIFPRRAGSQPWSDALKAVNARLREGHTWEEILSGARRYAAYIRAAGSENTEFVMQAKRFCGPSKPFLEPFDVAAQKPEERGFVC